MMSVTLAAAEAGAFSQLVGEVYDTVLDSRLWPAALAHACDFVGGSAANIFWQDAVDQSAVVFHAWGDDPTYIARYIETYAKLNPMFPAATFIEPGIVFAGSDLVPNAEFIETRFFKEWVSPQGFVDVLGTNIQRYPTSAASFSIRRGRQHGLVDATARARMELLVPHVQRAVLIGRQVDHQKAKSAMLTDLLESVSAGVFFVDPAGRLSQSNGIGRDMLNQGDLLTERDGLLVANDPDAHRVLRQMLAFAALDADPAASPSKASIVLTGRAVPRWLAHVLPLSSGARLKAGLKYRATAAVFVRPAELSIMSGIETIGRIYRLTPTEMRVLQAVVSESRIGGIAERLGVSVSTAKTHLAALFSKTGTNRQVDLVKAAAAHGNPLS